MADIRINITRTKFQASSLDGAASLIKRDLREIASVKQMISSCWDGTASLVFIRKLDEQYVDLNLLCRQIESVASRIRIVAERLQRQEEAVQKAAEQI